MSFLQAKALEKGDFIFKIKYFFFILVLKIPYDLIYFSVLAARLFHIAGPVMEIRNLHLRNIIFGFL